MDQFEPLESPYARPPGRWPTRPGRIAAIIVVAGLMLNIAVRSVFRPPQPLPIVDLFAAAALVLLLADRLRSGFTHFNRLEIARALSFSLPGVSGLRDSLMTRRGEAADLSAPPPPSAWSAAPASRDADIDTASRDEGDPDEDDEEDPWR